MELSNIHRQVAHTEADVGRHKADSAAAAARAINSSIHVGAHAGSMLSLLFNACQQTHVLDVTCSVTPVVAYQHR